MGERIARVGETDPRVAAPLLGLELEVIARGRRMVRNGRLEIHEKVAETSSRKRRPEIPPRPETVAAEPGAPTTT